MELLYTTELLLYIAFLNCEMNYLGPTDMKEQSSLNMSVCLSVCVICSKCTPANVTSKTKTFCQNFEQTYNNWMQWLLRQTVPDVLQLLRSSPI